MSLVDKTSDRQTEEIEFQLDLPYPPEKVWRALTDPALLAKWLLPVSGIEFRPGAPFTFNAPPLPGWDGSVHCRMLECEPPGRLSYTWDVGDMTTVVTFTITSLASGTRLSLVHAGFKPDQKRNFGGARYGWKMMTGRLIEVLDALPERSADELVNPSTE